MDPIRQLIPRRQIEELGERCRIYDHALRLIIVKTPHSLAAEIARQTLELGPGDAVMDVTSGRGQCPCLLGRP
jgi:hypothetical protein